MIKDAHCTFQGNECRICLVYRFGSLCAGDIKEFAHNQAMGSNPREAMTKTLDKKRIYKKE